MWEDNLIDTTLAILLISEIIKIKSAQSTVTRVRPNRIDITCTYLSAYIIKNLNTEGLRETCITKPKRVSTNLDIFDTHSKPSNCEMRILFD